MLYILTAPKCPRTLEATWHELSLVPAKKKGEEKTDFANDLRYLVGVLRGRIRPMPLKLKAVKEKIPRRHQWHPSEYWGIFPCTVLRSPLQKASQRNRGSRSKRERASNSRTHWGRRRIWPKRKERKVEKVKGGEAKGGQAREGAAQGSSSKGLPPEAEDSGSRGHTILQDPPRQSCKEGCRG